MNGKVPGVRYGIVLQNVDPTGCDMISVRLSRIEGEDKDIEINAFPLLPKMFYVKPKIGEGVFVLMSTLNDENSQKYYIGPVVSQVHRMYYEPYFQGGDSYQKGAPKAPDVNPYILDDSNGAYPNSQDVAILGRKNCDILIKDDDIMMRAGARLSSDDTKYRVIFNSKNPAYIKLKFHETPLDGDNMSTATIVADKINLISNRSYSPNIETTEPNDLVTDDSINKIIQDAYKLPYGEKLVDLLKRMIDIFCNHTHDFISKTPNQAFIDEIKNAADEPLEQGKLLSDTVRIN